MHLNRSSNLALFVRAFNLEVLLALCGLVVFSIKVTHITYSAAYLATAITAMWSLYMFDHVLDSLRTKASNTEHRRLLQELRHITTPMLMLSSCTSMVMSTLILSQIELLTGILLGLSSCVYFYFNHTRQLPPPLKEIALTFIFTAGIWFVPLLRTHVPFKELYCIIGYFAAVIFLNITTCSFCDFYQDRDERISSFATHYGIKISRTTLSLLGLILLAIPLLGSAPLQEQCLLFYVPVLVCLCLLIKGPLKSNMWPRIIADASFILLIFLP